MRRFVLVAHDARTAGDFPLDDLPGSAGRMDLVARCVGASLLVSHGVREDAEFVAVLLGPPRPPRLLRFVGAEIHGLNPDERSTGALIRNALAYVGLAERSVHRGIYARAGGLRDALEGTPSPILLSETGDDVRGLPLPSDVTFILSDHRDLTADETDLLRTLTARVASVGPRALQADQVVAIVHNELDRRT